MSQNQCSVLVLKQVKEETVCLVGGKLCRWVGDGCVYMCVCVCKWEASTYHRSPSENFYQQIKQGGTTPRTRYACTNLQHLSSVSLLISPLVFPPLPTHATPPHTARLLSHHAIVSAGRPGNVLPCDTERGQFSSS